MNILLSNDDGVHATGIQVMYEMLAKEHQVTVIAPDRNCSGMSNALSLMNPLRTHTLPNGFIALNGTPSDCVHLGTDHYFNGKPELVISGINHGPNLGDDVIYSGTVAAATEGRFMGLPAIAVSLNSYSGGHFATAAQVVCNIIKHLTEHPIAADQILNINVPNVPYNELKGIQVTRQGRRHKSESMIKSQDAVGREIYWYGKVGKEQDAGEGTDFHALANNYCSVTPLSVDMTAHSSLNNMQDWIEKL